MESGIVVKGVLPQQTGSFPHNFPKKIETCPIAADNEPRAVFRTDRQPGVNERGCRAWGKVEASHLHVQVRVD